MRIMATNPIIHETLHLYCKYVFSTDVFRTDNDGKHSRWNMYLDYKSNILFDCSVLFFVHLTCECLNDMWCVHKADQSVLERANENLKSKYGKRRASWSKRWFDLEFLVKFLIIYFYWPKIRNFHRSLTLMRFGRFKFSRPCHI